MSVNLFVAVYNEKHRTRKKELEYCLHQNNINESIDRIFILLEPETNHLNVTEKETIIEINKRASYLDFFRIINSVTDQHDLNIIVNSDIYFQAEDIDRIKTTLTPQKCYALARYDIHWNKKIRFINRSDAQDSWCFIGPVRHEKIECDFLLGKPGCDNRIAHELTKGGYDVTNPSFTIKSYHYHMSQVRNYERHPDHVVEGPYLRINPS